MVTWAGGLCEELVCNADSNVMSLVPTGMPLLHAIQILKIKLHFVKNISVNFCQKRPLESNIEVDLKEQGILLTFDHRTQRLKVCVRVRVRVRVCVCVCVCVRTWPYACTSYSCTVRWYFAHSVCLSCSALYLVVSVDLSAHCGYNVYMTQLYPSTQSLVFCRLCHLPCYLALMMLAYAYMIFFRGVVLQGCDPPGVWSSRGVILQGCDPPGVWSTRGVVLQGCGPPGV